MLMEVQEQVRERVRAKLQQMGEREKEDQEGTIKKQGGFKVKDKLDKKVESAAET